MKSTSSANFYFFVFCYSINALVNSNADGLNRVRVVCGAVVNSEAAEAQVSRAGGAGRRGEEGLNLTHFPKFRGLQNVTLGIIMPLTVGDVFSGKGNARSNSQPTVGR